MSERIRHIYMTSCSAVFIATAFSAFGPQYPVSVTKSLALSNWRNRIRRFCTGLTVHLLWQ